MAEASYPLRPCVIDSMFQVPWPSEIGVRTLPTQHKLIFNTVPLYCLRKVDVCLKFVLRIFKILKDQ
jgi:hypothetical protein